MAIVINGSGTVTGISVGGLPDGTVDTGTVSDNAIGLAEMASGTDGNIISYDASGNPVAVATGNDGQVLTSTGAGSPPAFEDAGGGGGGAMEFVSKTTISSTVANVSITGIDSSYDRYVMKIQLKLAGSNQLLLTYSQNNGSSFDTSSNYDSMGDRNGAFLYSAAAANAPLHTDGADWYISTLDLEPSLGWINASTGGIRSSNRTSNAHSSVIISHRTFSSFDALQFFASSGDISSGIITLYGIKDS